MRSHNLGIFFILIMNGHTFSYFLFVHGAVIIQLVLNVQHIFPVYNAGLYIMSSLVLVCLLSRVSVPVTKSALPQFQDG